MRQRLVFECGRFHDSFRNADVSIFHQFAPPPGGGGHQFLRALWEELERRGWRIENNRISRATRACLFNSFNFDPARLRRLRRRGCRMVHRVDGPISVYRGTGIEFDRQIFEINREFADATIFQSRYSLEKHQELGLQFAAPTVIHNAADPRIFHLPPPRPRVPGQKLRVIATSWSDNPNKGAADLKSIENSLDWDAFDFTFVGRSPLRFDRIRMLPPVPTAELADLLRAHDIFITASRFESCSNALTEALSCGLPAIAHASGSSPELVGDAGFCYTNASEIPCLLDRLARDYETRQAAIRVPALSDVADRYLAVLGLGETPARSAPIAPNPAARTER